MYQETLDRGKGIPDQLVACPGFGRVRLQRSRRANGTYRVLFVFIVVTCVSLGGLRYYYERNKRHTGSGGTNSSRMMLTSLIFNVFI